MTDEELLKAAQSALEGSVELTNNQDQQTMALQSIACSLLVIARSMKHE